MESYKTDYINWYKNEQFLSNQNSVGYLNVIFTKYLYRGGWWNEFKIVMIIKF